jgi:hypothetical protein
MVSKMSGIIGNLIQRGAVQLGFVFKLAFIEERLSESPTFRVSGRRDSVS